MDLLKYTGRLGLIKRGGLVYFWDSVANNFLQFVHCTTMHVPIAHSKAVL